MELNNYIINGRFNGKQLILDLQKENNKLKEKLAIREKALKLACERIKNMYEQEQQYCTNEIQNFVEVEKTFFIQQAKEQIDGNRN